MCGGGYVGRGVVLLRNCNARTPPGPEGSNGRVPCDVRSGLFASFASLFLRSTGLFVIMRVLSFVVVIVATTACPGAQKIVDKVPAGPEKPLIAGKFANEGCLSAPNADGTTSYLTLTFDVNPSTWASDVMMYGEETCTTKQGTIHMEGQYTIGNPSVAVPGAFEMDATFAKRTITPHVDGYIALMQSLSCGKAPYAVNQAQDIGAAGCKDMGFPSITECPRDHDLLKVEGDGSLRFGKRPADNNMCAPDKRPAELSTVVLKAVK